VKKKTKLYLETLEKGLATARQETRDLRRTTLSIGSMCMALVSLLKKRGSLSELEAKVVFAAGDEIHRKKPGGDPAELITWARSTVGQ
jgi:hypothetical protein